MAKYWVTIQYLSGIGSMLVTATSPEEAGKTAMNVRSTPPRNGWRFLLVPVSIVSVQELKPGSYLIQREKTLKVTPELLTRSLAQVCKAIDKSVRGVTTITPIEAGEYMSTMDSKTGKVAWRHPIELEPLEEKGQSE